MLTMGGPALFEQSGFTRVRQLGKHAWIVRKVIQPA